MFKVTICDIGKMNINMTDKIEKRRQPLQCRTMARTTTTMSMARVSAAMTAAWRQLRHELWRELQRITSKRATHTRRYSSTITQTIWVAVVTSPILMARWCSISSMFLSVRFSLRSIVAVKTYRISSMANSSMKKPAYTITVQDI